MKHVSFSLAFLCVTGCTVAERDYVGPTIRMQLTNNDVSDIQDTTVMPSFQLSTSDVQYSIAIEVFTTSGGETTQTMDTSSKVTTVTSTFSLAGMTVPSPSYMNDNAVLDPKFTSTAPIVLPKSALGGVLSVHATAVDGNDLQSNVIDLSISLK